MTASNIFGRQVILPLTNKSGGGVVAGDVVIIDSANNDAFTTTTTASYTGPVGIAQDTIANNAVGRVLVSGYAPLVNVNAAVTRLHYGLTHTVAKQATDGGASRVTGGFCVFLSSGTTPDAHLFAIPDGSSATGSVATDPIWDAAGDLAVGTGPNTAARLAIGAAGGSLSSLNGAAAWNSGTVFPSAVTGDRYWRTDLGLECYYDGTRWLSVQLFHDIMAQSTDGGIPISATQICGRNTLWSGAYDLWIVSVYGTMFSSSLSGSAYWTVTVAKGNTASSFTDIASFNDQSGTDSNWEKKTVAVGALLGASDSTLRWTATKTSTPGPVYVSGAVTYRLVLT